MPPAPPALQAYADAALARHGLAGTHRADLLTVSENATFVVTGPGGTRTVLRLHRPGYHTYDEIRSELAWVTALGRHGLVRTAHVLPAPDGAEVVTVTVPGAPARHAVRFTWLDGVEPRGGRLGPDFVRLGAIAARLHGHARTWRRPAWFTRPTWDLDGTIGPHGLWGDWRRAPGVDAAVRAQVQRAADVVARRLRAHGTGPDRFGLVHADMRLANLLVPRTGTADEAAPTSVDTDTDTDTDTVSVIDFDDCGFGWFLYDFGAAVSFFEHSPQVPDLAAAWAEGYRQVAPLSAVDEALLPTFVMLRRLLLVAWTGTRADAETVHALGPGYAAATGDLAEAYLSRHRP